MGLGNVSFVFPRFFRFCWWTLDFRPSDINGLVVLTQHSARTGCECGVISTTVNGGGKIPLAPRFVLGVYLRDAPLHVWIRESYRDRDTGYSRFMGTLCEASVMMSRFSLCQFWLPAWERCQLM
jgi:hypothetical protein